MMTSFVSRRVLCALMLVLGAGASSMSAQTFTNIPGLSFTAQVNGANPLPQVMTVTSTGAQMAFNLTPSTTTGGSWLSTVPTGTECCSTPEGAIVSVNISGLATGTYSGQILISRYPQGTPSLIVPVALTITAATGPSFGDMAGAASFSMAPGQTPPPQTIQVLNGGTGSLSWSLTASTADGGNWLNVPVTNGTAPSLVTVSVTPAALPGGGSTAGTYIGALLFTSASGSVSVPVSVTIGTANFTQINPLHFTMPQGGGALPQVLSVSSTGATNFAFSSAVYTGTGGNWLSISNLGGECCSSPEAITVKVSAATLAPGTYTGEIIFSQYASDTFTMTVPVSLTVEATTSTFLDSLPGDLSFFRTTTETPASQSVAIRNAGSGTLHWTATGTTADGGKWLKLSAASGTAPSALTVSVVPSALPGGGASTGTFDGQVVVQTGNDVATIPVSVVVGASVFAQVNPLTFTMPEGGGALPQVVAVASTGATNYAFSSFVFTADGGDWLTISNLGAECCSTPEWITVSVNAATLTPGIYSGEIVFEQYAQQDMALTVPVTLTVFAGGSTAFFDALPGEMTFSMTPGASPPGTQSFQIRNAGTGSLKWNLSTSTSDGGAWLTASAVSGTAPSTVTVSINPTALPSGGLAAGTYTGQISLTTTGDSATIPVTVTVGASVFAQVAPINFTMVEGGANPLPQVLAISSTGSTNIAFSSAVHIANGGSWLKLSNVGAECCTTPEGLTVSVSASTLTPGTYLGEITITQYAQQNLALNVPVTLTVEPATGAYFDTMPGQLSFFLKPGATAPSQSLQVRNAGTGTLNWTVKAVTADGGAWLTATPASGKAPAVATVSVVTNKLPGQGLTSATYNGQLIFTGGSHVVTVPISVTIGTSVFNQTNGLSFVMPVGGANPLPQILPIVVNGTTNLTFSSAVYTSTGGNWLTISNLGAECCATPENLTVSVNASTLAAGTYVGEIVISQYFQQNEVMTIPVTLTVVPCGSYFDNLPGAVNFSFAPSTSNPPSQPLQVRAQGSGALNWTLTTTTADGGNWLTTSSASGNAPSTLTIGVKTANLPGQGLTAGTYTGELVFHAANGDVSIPVSVLIGTNVFAQGAPLTFTMTLGGSNPAPQIYTLSSTGTSIVFSAASYTGNGGAWLSISPKGTECCTTPANITATISASSLPAGVYTGQMTFAQYFQQTMAQTVPVILTINDPHIPATITATSGTPQTATVAKAFAQDLVATVKDSSGNPVSGVLVTFNAPTSGASGTFACSGNTAITSAAGLATSQVFTANDIAGKYSVTATAAALTTQPGFSLTNKAGAPASVTASAGTPQSATVNTAFSTKLAAKVTDSFGNPVSGATVTFTAPASGASGTFAGGVNTAKTNAKGIATAPVFTANTIAGSYTVTAAVGTHTTNPGFALTNLAGAPAGISTTSGTPQSATVNTAFATQLAATIVDGFSNPVAGVTVTFNAPGAGASGTFAGGVNTAVTDANGLATAPVFSANTIAGAYTVTATTGALSTSPGFALTNLAGAAASIQATGGTPQSAAVNTAFAKHLMATVTDAFGNPIQGVTVTFTAPTSGASGTFANGANTAKTSATGVATAAVFTANGTAGSYIVTAKVGSLTTSPGFALTNTP